MRLRQSVSPSSLILFLSVAFYSLVMATGPAPTQAQTSVEIPGKTPFDEFQTQRGKVRESLETLRKKIDQAQGDLEKLTKPELARKEIEQLQALVAETLGIVADNGELPQLGFKALNYAREKYDTLGKETKYPDAVKNELLAGWKARIKALEEATTELSTASQEFLRLLRTVQTKGDVAGEWAELAQADKMINVIRDLAAEVRSASAVLKAYLRTLESPGM